MGALDFTVIPEDSQKVRVCSAMRAPTASDDASSGFVVGSKWLQLPGGGGPNEYTCFDATIANAVWKQTYVGTF